MKSKLCAIGVVMSLVFGSKAMAVDSKNTNGSEMPRPQGASCSTGSSSIFPNGYVVTKTCNGQAVAGIGTVLMAADTNASSFGQVGAMGGRYCSITTSGIQIFPGGYLADFYCDGLTISGVGADATDTGINALGFAQVEASGGRRCSTSTSSIHSFPGGYVSDFFCSGLTISGLGSTATDSARNALGFAQVDADGGRRCSISTSSISTFPGGYVADFSCSGLPISGIGTTPSDTGNNALAFAQVEAGGGRRCSTSPSSMEAFPGGYVADFTCNGLPISGVGTTVTDAGINASDFALLESAGGPRCSTSRASVQAVPGGYQVRFTCDGQGVTGVGSTVTAAGQNALQLAPPPPPPPPTPSFPIPPSAVKSPYTISWGASAGANQYVLEQEASTGGWGSIYVGPDTSWTVVDASLGLYRYRVKACASTACSEPSAEREFRVVAHLEAIINYLMTD